MVLGLPPQFLHTGSDQKLEGQGARLRGESSLPYLHTGASLVPRPSHRPVFDRLQFAKNGGGRPVIFYHVNDISVYLGRQRGGRGPPSKERILLKRFLF